MSAHWDNAPLSLCDSLLRTISHTSIFGIMKCTCLALLVFSVWLPPAVRAQNNSAAAFDRNAEEERYRKLSAQIREITENQEVLLRRQNELQQRCDALAREIVNLKEESSRGSLRWASAEDLKRVVDKMKEMEKSRETDRKLMTDSLNSLRGVPPAVESKPPKQPLPELTGEHYQYVVKSNDTLGGIVAVYNAGFDKDGKARITIAQVEQANPGLQANKIKAGTTILIPIPPDKKKTK